MARNGQDGTGAGSPPAGDIHVSAEALEAYAMGAATPDDVEEHVLVCPMCLERLQEADSDLALLREALARMPEERPGVADHLRRLFGVAGLAEMMAAAAAATAVLFVAVGYGILPRGVAPPSERVYLEARRGPGAGVATAGARPLITLDAVGLPETRVLRLEIVNAAGAEIHRAEVVAAAGGRISFQLPKKLRKGQYWVRLHTAGSEARLLREYGLEVR